MSNLHHLLYVAHNGKPQAKWNLSETLNGISSNSSKELFTNPNVTVFPCLFWILALDDLRAAFIFKFPLSPLPCKTPHIYLSDSFLCCSWVSKMEQFSCLSIVSISLVDEFIFSGVKRALALCVLYRVRQWFITHRQRHVYVSALTLAHTSKELINHQSV